MVLRVRNFTASVLSSALKDKRFSKLSITFPISQFSPYFLDDGVSGGVFISKSTEEVIFSSEFILLIGVAVPAEAARLFEVATEIVSVAEGVFILSSEALGAALL